MARYVDVECYRKLFDEEYKKTRKLISEGETHLDNLAEGFSEAGRVIDRMPAADVAPRSEVEALLKENERWMTEYANYREGVREVIKEIKIGFAREIFGEIEKMLEDQEVVSKNPREKEFGDWIFHNYIPRRIAELKKKYTEEPNV